MAALPLIDPEHKPGPLERNKVRIQCATELIATIFINYNNS